MSAQIFQLLRLDVEVCKKTGGYVARWDAPEGGAITTQGDTLLELDAMITDAVGGYFDSNQLPKRVRWCFGQNI